MMATFMEKRFGRGEEPGQESFSPGELNFPTTRNSRTMDTGELFHLLLNGREVEKPLAVATIISRTGSAPREPGASMLIDEDGAVTGSLGGGALEEKIIATARQAIREKRSCCRIFVLTASQAADEGMICGGRLEVLIDCLGDVGDPRREIMARAFDTRMAGRNCRLVYSLRPLPGAGAMVAPEITPTSPPAAKYAPRQDSGPDGIVPVTIGMGLYDGDEFITGTLDTFGSDPEALAAKIKNARRGQAAVLLTTETPGRYFLQSLTIPVNVVIAGAGHIARALVPLCRFAGFQTAIIDDRPEFACREFFPAADRIVVAPHFENCFRAVAAVAEDYIVIVTRGHLSDGAVLAQALQTGAAYIGMIGSRKKREAVYRKLTGEGCNPEALSRVHCPIGLAIGAQTPEEIAVSIVAELVACRSARRRTD